MESSSNFSALLKSKIREVHTQRVEFELVFEDGDAAAVVVGLYGTVE